MSLLHQRTAREVGLGGRLLETQVMLCAGGRRTPRHGEKDCFQGIVRR